VSLQTGLQIIINGPLDVSQTDRVGAVQGRATLGNLRSRLESSPVTHEYQSSTRSVPRQLEIDCHINESRKFNSTSAVCLKFVNLTLLNPALAPNKDGGAYHFQPIIAGHHRTDFRMKSYHQSSLQTENLCRLSVGRRRREGDSVQ